MTGAAITSGNYTGQGDIYFVQENTDVVNKVLGDLAGTPPTLATPPTVVSIPHSWSDM